MGQFFACKAWLEGIEILSQSHFEQRLTKKVAEVHVPCVPFVGFNHLVYLQG